MLLCAGALQAAELLVSTFYESRPFKGLEIELDGRLVGTTNEQGEVLTPIVSGEHVLRVLENGAALADYRFSLAADRAADLSIGFTDFKTPPEFKLAEYIPGQGSESAAAGATGTVTGTVSDIKGNTVASASVRIVQLGTEVLTDGAGRFELELPRGEYTLQISHPEYRPATRDGLRVAANVGVAADITLPSTTEAGESGDGSTVNDVTQIDEVVVFSNYKPTPSATAQEKYSASVIDAVSIEDLLRSGDSDVAATLKRIVGVSVTGGRYAVVRGLDGRYIAATLNGNLMPSTDPFRRDVQLDLFPADILEGIEIQKTFSADLPGDTTGGMIKINTRGMPDSYENSLSLSVGYTTGVTGEDLLSYEGGGTDWLGIDDGFRKLPGALDAASNSGLDFSICQVEGQQDCVAPALAAQLGASLPNVYNPRPESVGPDFQIGYALGNEFDRKEGTLGLYGAVSYDQSTESRQDAYINDLVQQSSYSKDQYGTLLNGYFVAGYEAASGWSVVSKTIILRDTENTTTVDTGIKKLEDANFSRTTLEWVERQFLAQQVLGKTTLFGGAHKLDWRLGLSQTSRYSPDRRSYEYIGDFLAISTVERSYSDLSENGLDLGFDYNIPVTLGSFVSGDIKFGALSNTRDREVELVRIGIREGSDPIALDADLETLLTAENFAADAFRLRGASTGTDSYDADQESVGAYLSAELNVGEALTVVPGVRYDSYTIDLEFPNSSEQAVKLDSDEMLPAFAAIYHPSESLQFRFGYSATVSRPNITELAPSRFYDENDRLFIGCPLCKASTIDNFDVRGEYYFGERDSVSLALFYKDITDPLEVSVADASGSASNALTFRNNKGATLAGVEIDLNKRIYNWNSFGLSVGANMSFIESEIELDEVGERLEIDPERDLQGQSPFLANLQISFEHFPWNQTITLVGNYFDDRIDRVTRNQPAIYEAGQFSLNLNYEKAFANESKVKFKVKNLLDAKTEYTQGSNTIESYSRGVEFSLGYSMNFGGPP